LPAIDADILYYKTKKYKKRIIFDPSQVLIKSWFFHKFEQKTKTKRK